jgi:uncharacterized low-complexity protein
LRCLKEIYLLINLRIMKKAKLNTRLAIAGALVSGLLMIVLVVGFTADNFADSNTNAIEVQSTDNALAYVVYDGKCGDDKNADKKAKDAEKAKKKEDGKSAKVVGDADKKKDDGAAEEEKKEGDAKSDESKEAKCGEGKCGEGKCGGDKAKEEESKCGEGKCGM